MILLTTISLLEATESTMIDNMTCKQQSQRRMRLSKRGARRAAVATVLMAASVYSGVGVAGFSSAVRPITSKVNSILSGKSRPPCHAVAPSLSTERSDTKLQGSSPGAPMDSNSYKDQHEFELSVGHAMDTLRTDYPDILTNNPGT